MKNSELFKDPPPVQTPDDSYAREIRVDRQARPIDRPKQNGMPYGQGWHEEPVMGPSEKEFQDQLIADERLAGVR